MSSGSANFSSNIFVVLKHTGALWPILNHKQFNCCLYLPYFKMPTITHVQQLIQWGEYTFSIDLQDGYLHIPIVKHHHCFFMLCLAQYTIILEGFTFWAGHSP